MKPTEVEKDEPAGSALVPCGELLLSVERQMLHAFRLAFDHPGTGAPLSFLAPLPPDFTHLLSALQGIS